MAEVQLILEPFYQWEMFLVVPLKVLYHIAGQTSTTTVMRRLMDRRSASHKREASNTGAVYSLRAVMAWLLPSRETSLDMLQV